jgi:hypothetical protein
MTTLLKFLIGAFSDKEAATRASGTVLACLTICYVMFPSASATNQKEAYQDRQNRLLWAEVAQMKNTLSEHHIYVPEIVDPNTATVPESTNAKENQ